MSGVGWMHHLTPFLLDLRKGKTMRTNDATADEVLDFELEIKRINHRTCSGGTWVSGSVGKKLEYRFEALVFPEHADNPEWEVNGDSRISKLWISRYSNKETNYNWDRGLDIPATSKTVERVIDFLSAGLASLIHDDGFDLNA